MKRIPCIKCNSQLWEYIKPYLEKWGYIISGIVDWTSFPILVLNFDGIFGECSNVENISTNRELLTDVEKFLEEAAKLKGHTYKRNNMKTITIQISDDCEIQIVKKEEKKETVIRTYQDLIDNEIKIQGFFIDTISRILGSRSLIAVNENKNIAASEKVAKSMLAMAQISQLMPYYGGAITDKEWEDETIKKYIIGRRNVGLYIGFNCYTYVFLAFHTEEQRDSFLKYNEQLVKDYLMIE